MDSKEESLIVQLGKIPFFLFMAILVIRLLAIALMGPMPQDAYYFFYAQHPALSYFDHPPAIAYLLKVFTWVLGKNVFAIKLADSVLTALTSLAVYQLALKFFPKYFAKKVIILFLSTLMVSILSLVSTPDTPLLFFWTLSLIALHNAIFKENKVWWLIAGVLMGLAFDSKYTAVFLPFGMFLFLLLSSSKRKHLRSIGPWLSSVTMIMVGLPVIIWNVRNHFASFAFQGSQRMNDVAALQIKPKFIMGLLGHQLFLLVPVLFIGILYTIYRLIKTYGWRCRKIAPEQIFLLCFFLPVFLAFLVLSPIYWIKINWMMPAYVTGTILAANYISIKWMRIQLIASFIIHFALLIELVFYPVPIKSDDTWIGWKTLYNEVEAVKKQQNAAFIFSADNYKTAAELNLYSQDGFIYGENVIGKNALQFDFIGTNLDLLKGKDAIYVDSDPSFKDSKPSSVLPADVLPYFTSVIQLTPIFINLNGKPVRKFFVYRCKGYKSFQKRSATDFLHN